MGKPKYLIVHHSLTPKDLPLTQVENSINRTHKARGFNMSSLGWHIGYQYIIYGDGQVRQYRKDAEIGAHTKEQDMNFQSIGICLSGNFDMEFPNAVQVDSLRKLMRKLHKQYLISVNNVYPHRHFAPYKSCFGSKLPDNWAKLLITQGETMAKVLNDNGTIRIEFGEGNTGFNIGVASETLYNMIQASGEQILPQAASTKQTLTLTDGQVIHKHG